MRIPSKIPDVSGSLVQLSGGTSGIFETVRIMRVLIDAGKKHPKVRAAAMTLTLLQPERDQLGEASKLFEFVRDHIRYVEDIYEVETIATADKTLELRCGDCDDKCVLLCSLLEAIGIPTSLVIAGYNSPGVFEHVYVAALISGDAWLALDPTEKVPPGWQPPDPVVWRMERTLC